ncbi:D-alanine--D-alanine ligase [Kineosporia sp. NBRC 101731]|uniref:D-alanine--D-alanine ligase family protein n=1 Tax=Kineosporia sp. NBRC 101731 TaxID=3032199 RepID=UPI0024A4693D|nr:D-alanine--D-alanine ligase [Kineosporia sp. NBRC 101731]GLY26779.1 D-alanine--D-alanine ligase A [Kineosporia sp. NBRC 101731]
MSARVAVVGGGQNSEHEVSLASAAGVRNALLAAGYEVVGLTIDRAGTWRDGELRPIGLAGAVQVISSCEVVVPMLHGSHGEDGTLAALCDLAQVPYVGSGVGPGAVAMDKWVTKLVAQAIGIPVAPGCLLTRSTSSAYVFTGPVVVKPVSAGSSHGVSLMMDEAQLPAALDAALALDDRVLVEEQISGREIDVAVLGRPDGSRLVAPPLEIVLKKEIFDQSTKYDGSAEFLIPADLSAQEGKALEEAALAMYDALGCSGVARVDFFLTAQGLVLNEVNTAPGFTEQSQAPKMFAAGGLPYVELVDLLVRDALATGRGR